VTKLAQTTLVGSRTCSANRNAVARPIPRAQPDTYFATKYEKLLFERGSQHKGTCNKGNTPHNKGSLNK
jgi:hypothetical protein